MGAAAEPERDRKRRLILLALGALGAVVLVVAIVLLLSGGDRGEPQTIAQEDLQTISFEEPQKVGEDPFTEPADKPGSDRIEFGATAPAGGGSASGGTGSSGGSGVGTGPFGGSGSDLVCDRELLIRSLLADRAKLEAWAGVLGIQPTARAVSRYIRSLRPVTLTVDTRVTNHTFVNGRAVPLQSVLAAGTAVLADKYGRPVVRCRCGNPLLEPIFYPKATCSNCPPKYNPPPPCRYRRFRPWYPYPPEYLPPDWRDPYPKGYPRTKPRRGKLCYRVYPKPPRVDYPPRWQPPPPEPDITITDTFEEEPTYTEPTFTAEPEFNRRQPQQEPPHSEPPPVEEPVEEPPAEEPPAEDNTYCYEADAPDRLEPGCQGTYGPPPP